MLNGRGLVNFTICWVVFETCPDGLKSQRLGRLLPGRLRDLDEDKSLCFRRVIRPVPRQYASQQANRLLLQRMSVLFVGRLCDSDQPGIDQQWRLPLGSQGSLNLFFFRKP